MRKIPFALAVWLLPVAAAVLFLGAGCKTPDEQSFNDQFNQNYPVAPKYYIEDQGEDHFKVRMHQGSPMASPSKVTYLKQAMNIVAENECRRRGWTNWKVDYIQESDQGWMHVLVAEVWRENGVQMPPPPPSTNAPPQ